MPTDVHRDQVRTLIDEGAQVVEVLPAEEYREAHLSGAISIPLQELDAETSRRLRRDRPVVTYCHDYQ
jgi:rhodanese-related sulfurtransferase